MIEVIPGCDWITDLFEVLRKAKLITGYILSPLNGTNPRMMLSETELYHYHSGQPQ